MKDIASAGHRLGQGIGPGAVRFKGENRFLPVIEQGKAALSVSLQGKQARIGIDHHQGRVQLALGDGHGIAALLDQIACGHGVHVRHQQCVSAALQGQQAPAALPGGDRPIVLLFLRYMKTAAELFGTPLSAGQRRQPPEVHLQRGPLRPGRGHHGHQQRRACRQGSQPHPNPFHQANASASAGRRPAAIAVIIVPSARTGHRVHHPFHGKSTPPDCQPFPPSGREYLHLR